MPEYDLVIRGGTIVDGTGIPRFKADLAVKDGRVIKISGRIASGGGKEIDASGCMVAPGAIDLHTHYDAQLNWDPYASLSGWHGVTSLTIGECGFGFAPTRAEDRELNMRMMNRIEAIPLESMRKGLRWDWETFPEYLDSLERQGLGVNIGSLFPYSPMRGYVLGMMEARKRTSVTDAELNQMKQLLHQAMTAGAFGFSLDKNREDRPEDGSFLPSHVASDQEFHALAEVLGGFGVGHIGMTMGFGMTPDERKGVRQLMKDMARISGRPMHVTALQDDDDPTWFQGCRAEGLPMVLARQCPPVGIEFKLSEFNLYDYLPNWVQPLVGTAEERMIKLGDPANRAAMRADVKRSAELGGGRGIANRTDYNHVKVLEVAEQRNHQYEGKTIAELGKMMGKDPLDAWFDLAIDEALETQFEIPPNETPEDMRELAADISNPFAHISASDGGAHTRFLTMAAWPVYWLAHWIRDEELMTLEEAHYKMSALPAWLSDFKNRGTLRVGDWADIMIYNMDELGYVYERPVYDTDFPGGERRMIQKPKGLRYTLVNGTVTFEGNDCTGALPGKLLRSYDMVD